MVKDEIQLIEEYLNGDEQAFESIVKINVDIVHNFVLRFAKNSEEAEDLTQEIFLKIWKNIRRFDRNKNFKTWMFSIARNTIIDWMRKKKDIPFSSIQMNEDILFEETLQDGEPLQDEVFYRGEMEKKINLTLDNLPEGYKNVTKLHIFGDLTFNEISRILGAPLNTVKSQYRRALISIKKRLT